MQFKRNPGAFSSSAVPVCIPLSRRGSFRSRVFAPLFPEIAILLREGLTDYGGSKRRGFDSLMAVADDYYDEQILPGKKRRLTSEQVQLLEQSFDAENKLEPERKSELARKLGLHPRQIAIWFQNRRARWKNKRLEHDFDLLKCSYDSLLADHDALLADNQRLRAEVLLLTEKLEAKIGGDNQRDHLSSPHPGKVASNAADAAAFVAASVPREDQMSSGSGDSVVADQGGCLPVGASSNSNLMEQEDGGSYYGSSHWLICSEEDGSEDGGAYFAHVVADDYVAVSNAHYVGDSEKEVDIMQWWVWN